MSRASLFRRALRSCLVPLPLLAFASSVLAQQSEQTPKSIRVDVERVNVGVMVTDSKGNFVEGLKREDFEILDSGSPRPTTDFSPVEAPAQVLLLIEAGPAVYLLEDSHLYVASALLRGLSPDDRVAIAVYNNAPTAVMDYTPDKRSVVGALDTIQFNLGFGDLNLAGSLNTVLDWLAHVPGKKSVVLISSGVETSAPQIMKNVLARLETGDVRIFSISMSGPLRNGKKGTKQQIQMTQQAFDEADAWLKALSEASGGRAYFPESAQAFQETYKQIAELLRHEYSLAFAPPTADGAVHAIDVKVLSRTGAEGEKNKPPEFEVSHRRGYIAPKPQP